MPGLTIPGAADNPARERLALVDAAVTPAAERVARLGRRGVRVHARKPDHYSGNVLTPLGLEGCVRVSLAHYNSPEEMSTFLDAMEESLASA